MTFNVIIPQSVQEQIEGIYCYIAIKKGNPDDALKLLRRVYQTIDSLSVLPKRGAELKQGRYANQGFRWILEGNYMIVYEIKDKDVVLQTIRHFLESDS